MGMTQVIQLIMSVIVGGRLLWLARTARQLPEFCLATSFLLGSDLLHGRTRSIPTPGPSALVLVTPAVVPVQLLQPLCLWSFPLCWWSLPLC